MTEEPEAKESFDRAYVEELRSESKGYRLKLRDTEAAVEALNAKLAKFENQNKSELERLMEEKSSLEKINSELHASLEVQAVNAAITAEALKYEVIDIEAVKALLNRGDLSFENGQVAGVEKALKSLFKEKPYLLKEPTPPPTAGVGGPPLDSPKSVDDMFLKTLKSIKIE